MNTNPLTEELYSIDWSKRFDTYDKANASIYDDLDSILTKIEGIIAKTLDVGKLQDIDSLKTYLAKTTAGTAEWRAITMLIDLRTLTAAKSKHLDHTAILCAMQIMGALWQSITDTHTSELNAIARKKVVKKSNLDKKNAKSSKPILQSVPKPLPTTTNNDSEILNVEAKGTANVVINNLAQHAEAMESKVPPGNRDNPAIIKVTENRQEETSGVNIPLSVQCAQVAEMLAEEYPQYTLTAIRVMTAEKLGVTRQYLENLDIKPKRFQTQ